MHAKPCKVSTFKYVLFILDLLAGWQPMPAQGNASIPSELGGWLWQLHRHLTSGGHCPPWALREPERCECEPYGFGELVSAIWWEAPELSDVQTFGRFCGGLTNFCKVALHSLAGVQFTFLKDIFLWHRAQNNHQNHAGYRNFFQ